MAFDPVSGSSITFQYALTTTDLPQGFSLLQDNETTYTCSQYWQTPNDSNLYVPPGSYSGSGPNGSYTVNYVNNRLILVIKNYNSSTNSNNAWSSLAKGSGATTFSFKGADKGLNITQFVFYGGSSYYAKKGNYLINIYGLANFSDVNTLMEAQLSKFPNNKSSPSFTIPLVFGSFSLLALVLLKKRERNIKI